MMMVRQVGVRVGLARLVSLTTYIELEGCMIPQNDTLYEADRPNLFLKFLSGAISSLGDRPLLKAHCVL